jgi:AraC-like DNA-binding protein
VISGHEFKRIRHRRHGHKAAQPDPQTFHTLLSEQVVARFVRLSEASLVVVPLSLPGPDENEDAPANPGHPVCAAHASTDYCRESWLLHLAQLNLAPETHWHRCDYALLCAMVPVVHRGRCLAVLKLASPPSTAEEDFERQVELLDIVVKDFVAAEADFLERLPNAVPPGPDLRMLPISGAELPATLQASHPQIVAALRCVEERLADPTLTVAGVARHVGVHPNYLSHLFAEQTGQRLSRFITDRRVERAKTLLVTTHWPIKRIAHETGYANPNWFSFVFRAFAGLTPSEYRKKSRSLGRDTPHP